VGDEDGFEVRPERRRVRLPALVALASLVTLGAVLGVTSSGWFASSPSDLPTAVPTQEPEVEILPTGRGPCVNDKRRTCQNSRLFFRNARSLKERETVIRRRLRFAGFMYEGRFEPVAPNATGGAGLLFRRGRDTAAVYLQPNAIAKKCPVFPLGRHRACADILSRFSGST
jgi:hypothetical protein